MKKEVIEKMATLVTAAFGLVAALAWNGAIQAIFKELFGETTGIWPMLIYAVSVTLLAVWVTLSIGKAAEKASNVTIRKRKEEKKEEKKEGKK